MPWSGLPPSSGRPEAEHEASTVGPQDRGRRRAGRAYRARWHRVPPPHMRKRLPSSKLTVLISCDNIKKPRGAESPGGTRAPERRWLP